MLVGYKVGVLVGDVALVRSSDRYGKFDWWSHDVGDPGF
jgi:hypothetical protein